MIIQSLLSRAPQDREPPGEPAVHVRRRLSDRIEDAFDQACEQGLLDVAACMLQGLDLALLGRPTPWDRRQKALGLLRASHDRLERLRMAADPDDTPEPSVTAQRTRELAPS